ncbi:MAG TPA: nucleoside hydrolase [Chroococcidiopsis sp.]
MLTTPLIIDCDPGVDDAIALLLAFASPELQLLGITTVAGNVPLNLTQKNARRICELANRAYVPVYAGCPRPLLRGLETAEHVHGTTGLQGANLPEVPQVPLQPQHGVDFLIETLMGAIYPVTVATLGPLTNLAIALIKEPRIAPKIDELVFMGGAIGQGNVTPSAEFNIFVDPHAAQVVFSSGIPLTMIGLDITHQVLSTPARLDLLRAIGTPVSQAAADMLAFYGAEEVIRLGLPGSPLHDPCVIAYLIDPDLFTAEPLYVEVETISDRTLGRTIVDIHRASGRPPNMTVVRTVNADGVYQLLADRLRKL